MAEYISELSLKPDESGKQSSLKEKTEEKSSEGISPLSERSNDFHVDFREDQEQEYPELGQSPYRATGLLSHSSNLQQTGLRSHEYERYGMDLYREGDNDLFYNQYGDLDRRIPNSMYYDNYYDDHVHVQSPTSEYDILSPRTRYDLACGPSYSRYGSQWDHHDDYGNGYEYLSPRYKMDSNRWIDREHRFSVYDDPEPFSPVENRSGYSNRSNYLSELDSYPSSYTYGMRIPRYSNTSPSYSINHRDMICSDEGYERYPIIDRHGMPFSDPASPQPMYSHLPSSNHQPVNDMRYMNRSVPKQYAFTRVNHSTSPNPMPIPKNTIMTQPPADNQISPKTPPSSQVTQNEENEEKEDENYLIDSQKIMQNLEERTVVLIRNIPNRYKLEDLQNVISTYVDEEYTVLRLPIDGLTKRNLGYAFVSFSDSHEVLKLYLKVFHF